MFVTNIVRFPKMDVKGYAAGMNETQTEPRSRRARPAKAPLSRDLIVETALRLLDQDGIDAVTMRKVAQELDTGPASLYVYIDNREQLLALMLDRVVGEIALPARASGDWRARLIAVLTASIEVLSRRQGLALVALAAIPVGPNALAVSEHVMALLREGGLSDATIAWAVDLLGLYVNAAAAEQSIYRARLERGESAATFLAAADRAFAALPPERYTLVLALRELLLSGSGEERLRWGLNVIINGLLATPEPVPNS
jgi:AcrR family transcriptional regulator